LEWWSRKLLSALTFELRPTTVKVGRGEGAGTWQLPAPTHPLIFLYAKLEGSFSKLKI
jgi:hypothetical protein